MIKSLNDGPPEEPGYKNRWVRVEAVEEKLKLGFELIRADKYPKKNYPTVKDGKYTGVIGLGGLLLLRITENKLKSINSKK